MRDPILLRVTAKDLNCRMSSACIVYFLLVKHLIGFKCIKPSRFVVKCGTHMLSILES